MHNNGNSNNPNPTLSRGELVTIVFTLMCGTALLPVALNSIAQDGILFSLGNTFGVSIIVWAGLYFAGTTASKDRSYSANKMDVFVIGAAAVFSFLPLAPVAWIAVTIVGLYFILTNAESSSISRASWIYVALSIPMFWSKRLFNFFSEYLLAGDAFLVSSITRSERVSNLVAIPGQTGFLEIAPRCSSMANVSLAILCWLLFSRYSGIRWQYKNVFYCLAACLAVIAINTTRISLIGFYPRYYDEIHGPFGSTITAWTTLAAVVSICYIGIRDAQKSV